VINQRKYYLDLLRILACAGIVIQHIAAMNWYSMADAGNWFFCNFYDAMTRFGVPVFFMISGVLYLDLKKEIIIKRLYLDHILKFLIIYGIWSLIYGVWQAYANHTLDIKSIILWTVVSGYHMWFLLTLIGIYMLVPLLRWMIEAGGKSACEYLILLFFAFQIIRETIYALNLSTTLNTVVGKIPVELACSYVGYFVLGYYLNEYELTAKKEKWIYILGVMGLISAVGISTLQSFLSGVPTSGMFDSYALPTFFASVFVFTIFVKKVQKKEWSYGARRFIIAFSNSTFGIYLSHVLFTRVLIYFNIIDLIPYKIIQIPFITLIILAVCGTVSHFVRKIPLIGKYLC